MQLKCSQICLKTLYTNERTYRAKTELNKRFYSNLGYQLTTENSLLFLCCIRTHPRSIKALHELALLYSYLRNRIRAQLDLHLLTYLEQESKDFKQFTGAQHRVQALSSLTFLLTWHKTSPFVPKQCLPPTAMRRGTKVSLLVLFCFVLS